MEEIKIKKYNKKEISWILYDCGNSAYSMAITTALLPVYFSMFSKSGGMDLGYFNSIASLIIAILAPILGTIADYHGYKKKFFTFFFLVGFLSTGFLALVPFGNIFLLVLLFILSAVGFSGSNIFYDALLVDVTDDERMNKVSTSGFAYGYIASVIPFAISLFVVYALGMSNPLGYRIGFIITALWWMILSLPIIKNVDQIYGVEREKNPIKKSFSRLFKTLKEIRKHKIVFTFLIAYFLYIDGVDTIIKMVVPYSESILGGDSLNTFTLLAILLIIQIIAFPCAILYGNFADKYGTRKMITVAIITYLISVIFAYNISNIYHIFILGALVGSCQGGIQALSRSYFAKIIPKKNSNEFFGFYNIFGKFAAILGPMIMAIITDLTGNARYSILGIVPLFLLGLIIFLSLPKIENNSY